MERQMSGMDDLKAYHIRVAERQLAEQARHHEAVRRQFNGIGALLYGAIRDSLDAMHAQMMAAKRLDLKATEADMPAIEAQPAATPALTADAMFDDVDVIEFGRGLWRRDTTSITGMKRLGEARNLLKTWPDNHRLGRF